MGLFALLMTLVGASVDAQQPKKIPRVGVLVTGWRSGWQDGFIQALRGLGYIDRQNIAIEYRSDRVIK